MKSKKTIVILSALAAVCLSSCDKNEEVSAGDGTVRFTAGIGKDAVATPQTRASGTAWGAGDNIGIFMVGHGTTVITESATNKKYTTATGNGTFTPVTGNEIYYPTNEVAPVDFIAYYPHRDAATLTADIPVDIPAAQTDATQADADLMWARADNATAGYTKETASPVKFTFGHCLSKLTMNCTLDANVAAAMPAAATVTIHGMHTHNTFDLATATLGTTSSTVADIAPRRLTTIPANTDAVYDAIILPGKYAANVLAVDFTIGSEVFTWDVDAIEFEPGHEYIYNVTITRTGVKAEGTIVGWEPVDKGKVTAE